MTFSINCRIYDSYLVLVTKGNRPAGFIRVISEDEEEHKDEENEEEQQIILPSPSLISHPSFPPPPS